MLTFLAGGAIVLGTHALGWWSSQVALGVAYAQKVQRSQARGLVYPYKLSEALAGPGGSLVELDLNEEGRLVEVDRARRRRARDDLFRRDRGERHGHGESGDDDAGFQLAQVSAAHESNPSPSASRVFSSRFRLPSL